MDKKYLKQVVLYVLAAVLSVGLILYIGYHLFYGLTQRVQTTPALISSAQYAVQTDLYIFREETPLSSAASGGSRVPAVSDGERVGVGDVLSRRYDVSSPDTVQAITELQLQLDVLELMRDSGLSVRDTAAVDGEIYALMEDAARLSESGNCTSLSSVRASLLSAMNRRAVITDVTSDIGSAISRLQGEIRSLTAQLGNCREELRASESGYYYSVCDGYEGIFTAGTALSMSAAEFEQLQKTEAAQSRDDGKLVTGYRWYAACFLPAEDALLLTQGQKYPLSFPLNGDKVLSMTVERLVPDGERTMAVFSSDTLPTGFHFTRTQPASVALDSYTGLAVPSSALRVTDGISGVYILEGSVVHYRAVQILREEDNVCIVRVSPEEEPPAGYSWLKQNDMIITSGRGLTEGRILS